MSLDALRRRLDKLSQGQEGIKKIIVEWDGVLTWINGDPATKNDITPDVTLVRFTVVDAEEVQE